MACGAVLVSRIRHIVRRTVRENSVTLAAERARAIVALEAQREHHRPLQQPGVHGPVRVMAALATVYANRRVLKKERTALVCVALQARLFVSLCLLHHSRAQSGAPRGRSRSMWIMAIRTLNNSLVDPVFERHGELRSHRGMAGIAEVCLLPRQQKLWCRWLMNGMATVADHAGHCMRGPADIGARKILRVTGEAVVQDFFRLHQREGVRNGRLAAASLDVCLRRAVATFTACPRRRFGSRCNALVVRIFVEVQPDVRVARLADRAAHIIGRSWIGRSNGRPGLCPSHR